MKKCLSGNIPRFLLTVIGFTGSCVFAGSCLAAESLTGPVEKQELNVLAIGIFATFVSITLGITYWAARRTNSRSEFYTAGGGILAWQNGIAISGDFLSAATLLGATAAIYLTGIDSLILLAVGLCGWPMVLILVAERLRNLGRYTFIDVLSYRLNPSAVRPVAALASLFILIFYLIGQLVGAGKLIQLLFGLEYLLAIISVSALMVIYVAFGGMLATTWVQFIKAVLLVGGLTFLSVLILIEFGFDLGEMFKMASERHFLKEKLVETGGWLKDPISVISVGLTVMFGFLGMPHILMRLFTVKDAANARKSAFYATAIIGFCYLLIIIIGFGAVYFVMDNDSYHDAAGQMIGGSNMVALHLSHYLGGELMLGYIAAVTFATILAVVSGLTISAAATVAHDLYAGWTVKGSVSARTEMLVSRLSVIGMGVLAVIFGILFEHQNIVFIITMSAAVAASAIAPVLLMAMYWPGLTTRGAIGGILSGLISSVIFIGLGPQVMVEVLGMESAIFPYAYPTVISLPLAFLSLWYFSVTDRSVSAQEERRAYAKQLVVMETGVGLADAVSH